MSTTFGSRRLDRSPATAGIALGDLLALLTFLGVGFVNHGGNPVGSPLRFAGTVAPFLVGWIVAALAVGAYGRRARRSVKDAALLAAGTWVVAAAIGLALRATPYFSGGSPPTFAAVITGFGLVFLVGWRALVAGLTA